MEPASAMGAFSEGKPFLSPEQRRAWEADGYLLLREFVSDAEVEKLKSTYRTVWAQRHPSVVVDDLVTNERRRLVDVSDADAATHHFKVNDLYLVSEDTREIILSPRMAAILHELLGREPVLCNTLSMLRGSRQPDHIDSIYMTPRTHLDLIATWIALEDTQPEAGPLRYWPGSHRIPPFLFGGSSYHYVQEEMPVFEGYYRSQLERRGLRPKLLFAKKGDVLIWHAQLLHGGSPIADMNKTRETLVSHFYSLRDSIANGFDIVPLNGAYWVRRPHQDVPTSGSSSLPDRQVSPSEVARALYRRVVPSRVRAAIHPVVKHIAQHVFDRRRR
jgi:ectoine hydroxylase-related dioxygenase (phytanoyl-CoA dioxygenase family)